MTRPARPEDPPIRPPGAFPPPWIARSIPPLLRPLARLHRYRAVGLEHIPTSGRAILAVSHSLATYDGFLLGLALYERRGRLPVGLGDDLIFRVPGLRRIAADMGIYPASPRNGLALLAEGHLLGVAPGGMREALRPSTERYAIRWDKRRGFVRLAIRAQAPIVLAACPAADDLYRVYESPLTKLSYKRLKLPIPLIRGWGLSLLPRPVQLVHHLAAPLRPPPYAPETFEADVRRFHGEVVARMEALMEEAPKGRILAGWRG